MHVLAVERPSESRRRRNRLTERCFRSIAVFLFISRGSTNGAYTSVCRTLCHYLTVPPQARHTTAVNSDEGGSGVLVDLDVHTHACRVASPAVTAAEQRLQVALADVAWREIGNDKQTGRFELLHITFKNNATPAQSFRLMNVVAI